MDLGAYGQINNLSTIMSENGIQVPRLRGLRLMKNEEPLEHDDIEKEINNTALWYCEHACCSNFKYDAGWCEYSDRTRRLRRKYLIYESGTEFDPIGIKWNNLHGKKRKLFKYIFKKVRKNVEKNLLTFNKYAGAEGILYIHARIGGGNWIPYGGLDIAKQPWFIEKIDDYFDDTYCDIYAQVK